MRAVFTALPLIFLAAPSLAVEFTAQSDVSAATVYINGATVSRDAGITLPAGRHTVLIPDLPLKFEHESLRAEVESGVTVLSVDHRVRRLPPADEAEDSAEIAAIKEEIEQLEAELRQLEAEKASEEARIDVADQRLAFVEALIAREPQTMVDEVSAGRADPATWIGAIDAVAEAATAAHQILLEANAAIDAIEREMEPIDEELDRAFEALAALERPAPERSIAVVELFAPAPVTTTLTLHYRVKESSWKPVYDVTLVRGEAGSFTLDRHAQVYQFTGEDWKDIDLTLSTAITGRGMTPPPNTANIIAMHPKGAAAGKLRSAAAPAPAPVPMLTRPKTVLEFAPSEREGWDMEDVPLQVAEIISGPTVTFRITEPSTIDGREAVHQIPIDSHEIDVDLYAEATPRLEETAYLIAETPNTFGGPLLPGRAAMFRDGTYLGEAFLGFTAEGDTARFPFGPLDEILIGFETQDREDGDFGIIGTSNRRVERYRLTARNLLASEMDLRLYDSAPVSEQEDLNIRINAQPRASETDADGERGVHLWEFPLAAGSEAAIQLDYTIEWPGDQQLSGH